ncbi:MAG TPA: pitrilysin family protein [Pyrinomonadaceae bacterium]|nr:pitrilysin family protein [Pyrinomonadaceae bacterium]
MKNNRFKFIRSVSAFLILIFTFLSTVAFAQEHPPAPGAPKSVKIPAVRERKLPNGLTVAVVERKSVPLVTVQLLVKSGAAIEDSEKAGLANMTASLLTKGTKTRTATQIAEQMEFLGGEINTGAGWNNSVVTVNVMADKLDAALAIMTDVVLNPAFAQSEIDLVKSQTLDGLTYNLKQPGFLANYVASAYSYGEHPAGGTPESLKSIARNDVVKFHRENYKASESVLIFTGDITAVRANSLARKFFGKWGKPVGKQRKETIQDLTEAPKDGMLAEIPLVKRILVVDLPNSGQASVNYSSKVDSGRGSYDVEGKYAVDKSYFPAIVLNSLVGGGYSSRLNQEIRIKRGLSYGAGSSFGWRQSNTNFGTRAQTKNESAAEVAELVLAEVRRLTEGAIADVELNPRKSVLTGGFGRNLETTEGLAAAVADLYSFDLPTGELNSYTKNVQMVSDAQIRDFARQNLLGGDIIIVGDYAIFKDDLAKRFPGMKIEVVQANALDLKSGNLRKN